MLGRQNTRTGEQQDGVSLKVRQAVVALSSHKVLALSHNQHEINNSQVEKWQRRREKTYPHSKGTATPSFHVSSPTF